MYIYQFVCLRTVLLRLNAAAVAAGVTATLTHLTPPVGAARLSLRSHCRMVRNLGRQRHRLGWFSHSLVPRSQAQQVAACGWACWAGCRKHKFVFAKSLLSLHDCQGAPSRADQSENWRGLLVPTTSAMTRHLILGGTVNRCVAAAQLSHSLHFPCTDMAQGSARCPTVRSSHTCAFGVNVIRG